MPTGSGLWHFLYRLVRKFVRFGKTWQLRHIIMMHFGNCDKLNSPLPFIAT